MKNFFKHIVLVIMAWLTLHAAASETLNFVKADGSKVSFSVEGLKITYDDFAHAVVTNNETSATLNLSELEYMYFGDEAAVTYPSGDVNGDGEVNIADINALIDTILSGNADSETATRADVNGDSEVNVADINALIDIILS